MRTAMLRLRGHAGDVEFFIVAFDRGSVSAWRMENGRATGRNIDFSESGTADELESIRKVAAVLATWHPGFARELSVRS